MNDDRSEWLWHLAYAVAPVLVSEAFGLYRWHKDRMEPRAQEDDARKGTIWERTEKA